MFANLALGTLLISATVLIHTIGLVILSRWVALIGDRLKLHRRTFGRSLAMTSVVLGLFFIHAIEIWLWAVVYTAMHVVDGFETALYFSSVTYSTVGYGDITATPDWQLFASFEAIVGFILIGWSIAYLIAASTRLGPFRTGEDF